MIGPPYFFLRVLGGSVLTSCGVGALKGVSLITVFQSATPSVGSPFSIFGAHDVRDADGSRD